MSEHIFFIGIGGVSMNAIALLLQSKHIKVSGSDRKQSEYTKLLESNGVKVFIGHDANHITEDITLVVYNLAVPEDNPEIVRAKELGIPLKDRPTVLGEIMRGYKVPICVAGAHGKTTASAMTTELFTSAGKNPTALIGGTLPSIGGAIRIGGDEFFIAESCEYRNAFLSFFPKIGVILNVDFDHPDFFGSYENVIKSFVKFAEKIPQDGFLVIFGKAEKKFFDLLACSEFSGKTVTYGVSGDFDVRAENISYDEFGKPTFDIFFKNTFITRAGLSVAGEHSVLNALAAAACALVSGITAEELTKGLAVFRGTARRFELRGKFNGAALYDDYAHHPAEIETTLKTAKLLNKKVWCAFQSHTKNRTKQFLYEFADALSIADVVIMLPIYNPPGREEENSNVSSADIAALLEEKSVPVYNTSGFEEAKQILEENISPEDIVITMGAGDVDILTEMLLGN
jgi:UDP-N-acetylmuramate--alanine ligase